jgi:hypothetical protein
VAETSPTLERPTVDETPTPAPAALEIVILLLLGLVWLGNTLRLANQFIANNREDAGQLASAISLVLPTVVYASLLAGAGVGLCAGLLRLARPDWHGREATVRRGLVGAAAAAVLGVLLTVLILARYGGESSVTVLAVIIGIAALLGGAAGALPRPLLAAGVTGTLEVFIIGFLVNLWPTALKSLLGAGSDPASQVRAASWLAALTAIAQGIVVGITAYTYLKRRAEELRWPAFAAAGAFPGVLLLVGLGLSLIGGSGLSNLADQLSDADRLVRQISSGADLNQALTVAFVGTIVAMIAVGRTLRRPAEDE